MTSGFLFRLDGGRENDDVLTRRRQAAPCVANSGTAMLVGSGWVPDLVEIEESGESLTITLIELEAAEIAAKVS
jgi:hypothetical protein